MKKKYYSVFDIQKKDIVSFSVNRETKEECINDMRSWVSSERDITSINDNDFFENWEFAIIEHEDILTEEMFKSINISQYKVVLPYNFKLN